MVLPEPVMNEIFGRRALTFVAIYEAWILFGVVTMLSLLNSSALTLRMLPSGRSELSWPQLRPEVAK